VNRSILGVGAVLLVSGILLFLLPTVLPSFPSIPVTVDLALLFVPIGLGVLLLGVTAPNPELTTVAGMFGNPVEEELRQRAAGRSAAPPRRAGSPREPIHCRQCYTFVPWSASVCPRCGLPRECHQCGRPVEAREDVILCGNCGKREPFCSCPRSRPARPSSGPGRLRSV
jgi:hypothetical protein